MQAILNFHAAASAVAQQVDPAGGAPTEDLVPATVVAAGLMVAVAAYGWLERTGRVRLLAWGAGIAERVSGLPGWASLPAGICGASLVVAAFGFYWDVSLHIDAGRDAGPFANPGHWFIIVGLLGIAFAGITALILGSDERNRSGLVIRKAAQAPAGAAGDAPAVAEGRAGEAEGRAAQTPWRVPLGGWLLLLTGGIALLGFPLDDVWHRLFGQDVTLWGPTHLQMIEGASLGTLGLWLLLVEGERALGPDRQRRGSRRYAGVAFDIAVAGAFMLGLSTIQGEFDFGVPQFRLLYHPVLIALAAGIGLVAARVRIGRGGALGATAFFLAVRIGLAVIIAVPLHRVFLHFPLYLAEAVLVELVALRIPRHRNLTLGAVAGGLIGTVGVAAGWAWTQVGMPIPWTTALLPEVAIVAPLAGVAGGVIGALIGGALAPAGVGRQRLPRRLGWAVAAAAVVAVAYPLPIRSPAEGWRASVELTEIAAAPERTVDATVQLRPSDLAEGAEILQILAWQGAGYGDEQSFSDPLEEIGPGLYRTTRPLPVHGEWKAVLRVHRGSRLAALPIFLPEDRAIPADEVPADPAFTRDFVTDKTLLQREFTGGPWWLTSAAYLVMLGIAVVWISAFVWALRRVALVPVPAREGEPRALRPVLRTPAATSVGGG